ncbi:MAG: GNAT family N-acetyltransferase [Rhodobacteraceae bacterium]|nr:GNAT family N-acetyltransferase [Paracoccaceae bacterium]
MNTIETERLILRPPVADDLDAFARMWADAETLKHIPIDPNTRGQSWGGLMRIAGCWALKGYGQWMVLDKTSDKFLGHAGFFDAMRELGPDFDAHREAGWVFTPEASGKGFATEAMLAALGWMDRQSFGNRTVCMIGTDHNASIRVAEKCGYSLLREAQDKDGDIVLMTRKNTVVT